MYTVRWMPIAFEQMATIIRDHPQQKSEFRLVLKALTQTLSTAPASVGESRDASNRIVFWGPISFVYRFLEIQHRVEILSVAYSVKG